jgi:hypothetical protein
MTFAYTLGCLGALLMLPLSLLSIDDPWVDADGDGVPAIRDCDDNDPEVYFWQGFYLDEDHDGYGTGEIIQWACWGDGFYHQFPLDERSFNNLDCDDLNPLVNPGMPEIPDNDVDENCDGILEYSLGTL